jgi:hypothetical protein
MKIKQSIALVTLLIPMILATNAAIADAPDAQSHAAALLSRPHALVVANAESHSVSPSPESPSLDAHASAAALLSGARPKRNPVNAVATVAESTAARVSTDSQAQAAAILTGSRSSQSKRADGGERTMGRSF